VGGSVFEAGLLACGIKHRQFSLIPRWHGMDPAVKQVLKQFAPMAAGAFFMGGTELIDQSMAAMLGPGSVSALTYGNKLVMFILVVGSGALGTAIFPHFSRMTAVKDWDLARHTLKSYTRLVLIVTIPLTLMLIYLSEFLVGILFERGAFVAADTRLVGDIQALYLLQIPFYVLGIMGVRLLSAMKKNQTLMVISAINLITNIVGNYVFMSYLGVAGISLSTSVVYAISMSLIFLSLNSELRKQVSNE
jgi:putative peptidoglycan lipid II flippase